MIRLHDYWRSSASYRVRIALQLKQVPFETVSVNLLKGDQRSAANLAVNPQGLVPTLEVDGVPMTQSMAIIDYLDRIFPDPPLFPAEPIARARALAMALVIAADIHPLNNTRVLNRLSADFGADQVGRDAWYAHWIADGFRALELMACNEDRDGAGPFLGGDRPGIADICLVPQMYNARRFNVPVDAFPRLIAADAAATALPAFAAAHPDRAKPIEP
ncbi:MAG: maleylacetoacetate isomerase [Sphingomonas sp.]|nr:maleylacetoacetate isomerase [Sphingomonas sp.]